jgi:predicted  nucleic acid-binding Zn-ribbon protein
MKLVPGFRVSLLLLSVAIAACGPSQADFDRAKQQLQLVTVERDNLKSQLDQLQSKLSTLQQQVTTLEQAAAAKVDAEQAAASKPAKAGKKHARAKPTRRAKRR